MKYGFANWVSKHSTVYRSRPKRKEYTEQTEGLFIYLTRSGALAKRAKDYPEPVRFYYYEDQAKTTAFVWATTIGKWYRVPVDQLHEGYTNVNSF